MSNYALETGGSRPLPHRLQSGETAAVKARRLGF